MGEGGKGWGGGGRNLPGIVVTKKGIDGQIDMVLSCYLGAL